MKITLLNYLIGIVLILFANQDVYAQSCGIDTSVNGFGGTGVAGDGVGQSFTACASGMMYTAKIQSNTSSPNTMRADLYSGEGYSNYIGSTPHISVSQNRVNQFDFSQLQYNVVEGQKYTVRFILISGTVGILYSNSTQFDYYAGGRVLGVGAANNDMFFEATIITLGTQTLTPAHQATEVTRTSPISIQFQRNLVEGTGDLVLKKVSDNEIISTVPASDIVIDGNTASLAVDLTLEPSTEYSISVPTAYLKSSDGINMTAIASGNWTFTTTGRPATILTTEVNELTNSNAIQVAINFTEEVTGFDLNDITVANAALANFSGSGTSYTVDLVPSEEGEVTILVDENVAEDVQQALNTASNTLSFTYDITFNDPIVNTTVGEQTSLSTFDLEFELDEAFENFTAEDFALTNCTIVSFSTEGLIAKLTVAVTTEGQVTVNLPAGTFNDVAGNVNTAASFSTNYVKDLNFGLLAFYSLDGNTIDFAGKTIDLAKTPFAFSSLPDTTSDRFNALQGSFTFDLADILYNNQFTSSTAQGGLSASLWINPTFDLESASTRRTFFTQWISESSNTLAFFYEAGFLKLELNNKANVFEKAIAINKDSWYHLAFSVTLGGKVVLYVNNTAYEVGDTPETVTTSSQNLYIGAESTNLNGIRYSSMASIDELKLYDRPLSAGEVNTLYTAPQLITRRDNQFICSGDAYETSDLSYTEAGKYIYTIAGGSEVDTLISLNLTINALPAVFAKATSLEICEGESVTLSGRGEAISYTYFLNDQAIDSLVSPIETTTYSVAGVDGNGCKQSAEITVTVNPFSQPIQEVIVGQTAYCDVSEEGTTVSIPVSEIGFNYYLKNAETQAIIAGPMEGTGDTLVFSTGALNANTSMVVTLAEQVETVTTGLEFDGLNDRINIPHSESLSLTNEFTLEVWIKSSATTVKRILSNYTGSGASAGDIVLDTYSPVANNGKALRLYLGRANGVGVNIYVSNVITLNEWNHLAATFKHGAVKLYVNGNLVHSEQFPETSLAVNTRDFGLGEDLTNAGASEHFSGFMDDVRIWNYARNASEISGAKDSQLTGNESGLVLYYTFDDGAESSVVTDRSTFGNDGTLENVNVSTSWKAGIVNSNRACTSNITEAIQITVGDQEAPAAIFNNFAAKLGVNGTYTLNQEDFTNDLTDNCSEVENLIFEYSKSFFTCEDLGENEVTVTLKDEAGNEKVVTILVTIENYVEAIALSVAENDICAGSSADIIIGNTLAGANYYLYNTLDQSTVAGPIQGNGGDLSVTVSNINENTTYGAFAEIAATPSQHALKVTGNKVINLRADSRGILTEFTYALWVKTSSVAGQHYLITRNGFGLGYVLSIQNGRLNLYMNDQATGNIYSFSENGSAMIADGEWHHVVFQAKIDADPNNTFLSQRHNARVFVDGQADIFRAFGGGLGRFNYNYDLQVGLSGYSNDFEIDQLSIWNTYLDEAGINAIKNNSCLSASAPNLTGLINFDNYIDLPSIDQRFAIDESNMGINSILQNGFNLETDRINGVSPSCAASSCEFTFETTVMVTLAEDQLAPMVAVKNVTVYLDETGLAAITAEAVNNGSTDNCTTTENLEFALENAAFDCSNLGENEVTLTVIDLSGNIGTATAIVTVVDTIAPVLQVKEITISLSTEGFFTVDPASVDDGSSDNCGSLTFTLDKTEFTTEDIGKNIVLVTVTDATGLTATGEVSINVIEYNAAPEIVNPITSFEIEEDAATTVVVADLNEVFVDEDALTFTVTSSSAALIAEITDQNQLTITPAANFFGTVTLTITAADIANAVSFEIEVTILPVNDAPEVTNPYGNVSLAVGDILSITVPKPDQFSDIDEDELSYSIGKIGLAGQSTEWILTTISEDTGEITLTGTPEATNQGVYRINVTATDGALAVSDVIEISVFAVTEDLALYYPFGGNANNAIGADNHGVVTGATLTAGYDLSQNSGYSFAAPGDKISFGDIDLTTESFTVSFWMKSDVLSQSSTSYRVISQRATCTMGNFFDIALSNTSGNGYSLGLEMYGGSASIEGHVSTGSIGSPLDWNLYTFVKDNESRSTKVYLNDQLVGVTHWTFQGDFNLNSVGELGIAVSPCINSNNVVNFRGKLDEVRLYKRAITADEIATLAVRQVVNLAPEVVNAQADVTTPEKQLFELTLAENQFVDVNEDEFQLSMQTQAAWLTFNAETRTLRGTPQASDLGIHLVTITANDGISSASDEFTILVENVNDAPTAIAIDHAIILESMDAPQTVGELSAADEDVNDTHTFELIAMDGAMHNESFFISGNTLSINVVADFEELSAYLIGVRATDNGGLSFDQLFTITVQDVNEQPTGIALSNSTILEKVLENQTVGTLSTIDPDMNDTHSYSFSNLEGSDDNELFSISGDQLVFLQTADIDVKSAYTIGIRSTDAGGLSIDQLFTISVQNANDQPTGIVLSNATILEASEANQFVGTLSTVDPDANDTHTYSFSNLEGSDDNALFSITGNQLVFMQTADFETKSSYTIGIRTTDLDGLFFNQLFTISVIDVNEAPSDILLSANTILEHFPTAQNVGTLTSIDEDLENSHTYAIVPLSGALDNAAFQISGNTLQFISVADFEVKNSYTVGIRTTDQSGLSMSKVFTIVVIDGVDPLSLTPEINIEIYPNPTSDYLYIQSETPVQSVQVLSLDGKEIMNVERTRIDVSQLPKGAYLVRISTDGVVLTKRLIKQ